MLPKVAEIYADMFLEYESFQSANWYILCNRVTFNLLHMKVTYPLHKQMNLNVNVYQIDSSMFRTYIVLSICIVANTANFEDNPTMTMGDLVFHITQTWNEHSGNLVITGVESYNLCYRICLIINDNNHCFIFGLVLKQ